jgi:hypothetical protein
MYNGNLSRLMAVEQFKDLGRQLLVIVIRAEAETTIISFIHLAIEDDGLNLCIAIEMK